MTEQEKKIKRYVNAIERELRLPLKAKARINGDIGTDIHARLEKGQSIDEIIAEMGTPQEVAAGFNEEMQDQLLPKGSPWRWVFLIAAILAGGAALLSILPFLLFYFQSSGMGVIGGADGPTAIFITGAANFLAPMLTPLWLAVPFILGCCAACVLLRWGQNGPRAKHTLALMFSAAALLPSASFMFASHSSQAAFPSAYSFQPFSASALTSVSSFSRLALYARFMPKPNSALSSNRLFAHAGPWPSLFTV